MNHTPGGNTAIGAPGSAMRTLTEARYRFIEDPGHGWLEVPRSHLAILAIEQSVSPYSYQQAEYVYLEEDCDYPRFAEAWQNFTDLKIKDHIRTEYQDNTFVRGCHNYSPRKEGTQCYTHQR